MNPRLSAEPQAPVYRPVCGRCLRPAVACYCAYLPALTSRTRVVFLQHPRERRVPVGTCRMAHLSLVNSELHVGVDFAASSRLRELAAAPRGSVVVLFPGAQARDVSELGAAPPSHLVVIDGTWVQARKVLKLNPLLGKLPQVAFSPPRPGNYRIRREPAAHCVSTIEAVALVMGVLERDPARFESMLRAFDFMVERQLEHARARVGPPRRKRPRDPSGHRRAPHRLPSLAGRVVTAHVEANVGMGGAGGDELIQLVAERLESGERFGALIRPARAMAESTLKHAELEEAHFATAEEAALARARFTGFLREGDVVCVWGGYSRELLLAWPFAPDTCLDVRPLASKALGRRPGGVELAAHALGHPGTPWAPGRAGRRLAALTGVVRALASAPKERGS